MCCITAILCCEQPIEINITESGHGSDVQNSAFVLYSSPLWPILNGKTGIELQTVLQFCFGVNGIESVHRVCAKDWHSLTFEQQLFIEDCYKLNAEYIVKMSCSQSVIRKHGS
jgi:hypothetical protein